MSKKDAYYFSHDSNARHDPKIIRLRAIHGLEGYGFYFCILEIMRESAEYAINHSDLQTVAYQLNLTEEKAESIFNTCVKTGLFKIDNDIVFSESFKSRMIEVDKLRNIRAENGKKGGRPKSESKNKSKQEPEDNLMDNQNESKDKAKQNQNESIKSNQINKSKVNQSNQQNENESPTRKQLEDFWGEKVCDYFTKVYSVKELDPNKADAKLESCFASMAKGGIKNQYQYLDSVAKKCFEEFRINYV